MEKPPSTPDFARLRRLRLVAIMAGVIVFAGAGWMMDVFRAPEVATAALAFAFAAITFSALFYFGALLTEGSLQKYILKDETVIKGDNVEMVTHTKPAEDAETERWVGTYVFTRNLFGMSVIPLLILAYFYFFG
ncbi:hypothetical protein K1X12_12760 [Hyphomonas sp. WL0036]|uniref:hypothetical protein n=1 Tax=Hyphomonas sediminis TaxID=2866160 RepID=UPI001C815E65|nr:hypothetical protein [Hyphomonas sediminis]MBY9067775.1 hypothetical protein [Hyphomonas sediminis]